MTIRRSNDSPPRVLIVDDTDDYRAALANALREKGVVVVEAGTGEEAVARFRRDPSRFEFAVIDQKLGPPGEMDGIATTRALIGLDRNLFALVFTNVPSDDPEAIASFRRQALEAGAFRYLERRTIEEAPIEVARFIEEMDQLSALSERVQSYYAERDAMPSLAPALPIGLDIIDRSYKVWFMNGAQHQITGWAKGIPPLAPCCIWHRNECAPCPLEAAGKGKTEILEAPCFNCQVEKVFRTGEKCDAYFLSKLPDRDPNRLFFMRVWAQPVLGEDGQPLLAQDKLPLAATESVQDLTDSAQLWEMSLDQRLGIILSALFDMPKAGLHRRKRRFRLARVMTPHGAAHTQKEIQGAATVTLAVSAVAGEGVDSHVQNASVVFPAGYLNRAIENAVQHDGYGYFFLVNDGIPPPTGFPRESFILWPIMDGENLRAILEVRGPECVRDDVEDINLYAKEVESAFAAKRGAGAGLSADEERYLGEVDLQLQGVATLEEALALLLKSSRTLTNSLGAHIRYVEGNDALLLRIPQDAPGEYERVAPLRRPLSDRDSWSVRAILSGSEQAPNMDDDRDAMHSLREKLSPRVRRSLDPVNAACVEPIFHQSRVIGCLCLHAAATNNFTESRRRIARELARRVALALHDYLIEQKAETRIREIQEHTIGLVLHSIKTPLGIVRLRLGAIQQALDAAGLADSEASKSVGTIRDQLDRIAIIRERFMELTRPRQTRIHPTKVFATIEDARAQFSSAHPGISIKATDTWNGGEVRADADALRECLNVLLQNACEAVKDRAGPTVRIALRETRPDEVPRLTDSDRGFAVDVEDNGPGVAAELRDELFRVIRSSKATGLGFGLARSREIARSSHGEVYLNADFKSGACFTLLMPYWTLE